MNPDTFDALADELGFQRDVVDGEEWIDALMAAARADSEEWWNSMEFWRVFYTHMNESVLKTMGVLLFDDLPAGFGSTPEIGTVSVRRLRRSAGRAGRSPRRTCASTATGTRWRSSYPTETRATSYAKTSAFAATSS